MSAFAYWDLTIRSKTLPWFRECGHSTAINGKSNMVRRKGQQVESEPEECQRISIKTSESWSKKGKLKSVKNFN